jgi:hypothetical protein
MNVGSRLPILAALAEGLQTAGVCRLHCKSCFTRDAQSANDLYKNLKGGEMMCRDPTTLESEMQRDELQTFILCDSTTQPAIRHLDP